MSGVSQYAMLSYYKLVINTAHLKTSFLHVVIDYKVLQK